MSPEDIQPDEELMEQLMELVERYGADIYVRKRIDGKLCRIAFAELLPEEQKHWIETWALAREAGWDGPHPDAKAVE